jgi:hypothetical protein
MVLDIHTVMPDFQPLNRCRMCGASSYRPVVDRDGSGGMRATGLYRCSGCSVVFADPRAWREGGADSPMVSTVAPSAAGAHGASTRTDRGGPTAITPSAPDLRTYGPVPGLS